jgi:hypothetical protein
VPWQERIGLANASLFLFHYTGSGGSSLTCTIVVMCGKRAIGSDVRNACLFKVGREDRVGEEGMLCQRISQRISLRA